VSLHVPTFFWGFLKCVDLHVPTYFFANFLYAKGILKQKHVNAIIYLLLLFSMPPRYRVHGALKNAKAENIFMIFSMQV
jgi:hypothetical protein